MKAICTAHAQKRAQQRGVPPLVRNWLMDYGHEQFDGHGGAVRYFTRDSIRQLERDHGRTVVKRLSEYLRCYMVESTHDGSIITMGKRHAKRHIWRH